MMTNGHLTQVLPEWLNRTFVLAEGEDAAAAAAAAAALDEQNKGGDSGGDPEDTAGLRSALQKERQRANDAEKLAKASNAAATKLQQDAEAKALAELAEIDRLKVENEQLLNSVTSLASGYVKDKLDAAIRTVANTHGFADPDDAIALINRSNLTYTQDKSNPSEVAVDTATVEKEVKDLITRKPHLKKADPEEGGPSGSTFGNKSRKTGGDEEALRATYPSLR